jgi:hypothetical protein
MHVYDVADLLQPWDVAGQSKADVRTWQNGNTTPWVPAELEGLLQVSGAEAPEGAESWVEPVFVSEPESDSEESESESESE